VFLKDSDRLLFLEVLRLCVERFGWFVHAHVLMGNHYHLLVETPRPNLARGMRQLNGVYALRFNRRHGRWGHLFGHRYKAILIERETHLLEVARYVVRNPVRAGLCPSPLDWPWSSCRATAGVTARPAFLTVDWLLEQFGPDRDRASRAYRRFVEQPGEGDLIEKAFAGIYLAGKPFLRSHGGRRRPDREIPYVQQTPLRVPLAQLLRHSSDHALVSAYREHGYTLREIAEALGIHYASVSRRLAAAEATAAAPTHTA
jgi:putative transposase